MKFKFTIRALSAAFLAVLMASGVKADPIRHPTAVFAGLDKTTGRIINFDVAINETVQFGALQVTPRVCNTRPQTEAPQTTSFVEVDELILRPGRPDVRIDSVKADSAKDVKDAKRIFSGWMFAASPGLHGVEHPVYDVWLVDCKGGKEAQQTVAAPPSEDAGKKAQQSRRVEPTAPAPVENQPIGPADSADPAFGDVAGAPDAAASTPVEPDAGAEEPPKKKKKKRRSRQRSDDPAMTPVEPGGNPLMPF
ncbi:MAG: DUF2155 domain-containing protein [Methylocystis sp.]|nr:DUF2155 domain-containing protein [Methylocystis sp.]